jgi:hypothetical protein
LKRKERTSILVGLIICAFVVVSIVSGLWRTQQLTLRVKRALASNDFDTAYYGMSQLASKGALSPVLPAAYSSPKYAKFVAERWHTQPDQSPTWAFLVVYNGTVKRYLSRCEVERMIADLENDGSSTSGTRSDRTERRLRRLRKVLEKRGREMK